MFISDSSLQNEMFEMKLVIVVKRQPSTRFARASSPEFEGIVMQFEWLPLVQRSIPGTDFHGFAQKLLFVFLRAA